MSQDANTAPVAGSPPTLKRLIVFAVAIAVGGVMALLAPEDWQAGAGSTSLSYRTDQVIDAAVAIGPTEPISFDATSAGLQFELEYPGGVPVDQQVNAAIAITRDGRPVRPDISELVLRVELPDGRDELIPIIRWNEEEQQMEALRRPTKESAVVLALLGFVVVLWVTEAVPLFVTSLLIPVVLVFSGVAGAVDATAPFFNPIIVLFFAGFLMAEAMRRVDLDHFVSVSITARAGRSAPALFGAMLAVTAFLSMWMSNTASAAVLVPIALAVTKPIREEGFRRALVLGIAYAATIGGVGSAIGTPANQLAIEFLDEFGDRTISFVEWFAFGLPMVAILLPIMGAYLWKRSRIVVDSVAFRESRRVAVHELTTLGRPSRDQLTVLAVFVAVALGWLTQTVHGFHAGIVALAGAVVLFMLGKLLPEDLGNISWSALITFGGALSLGLFLVDTGTSDYVATRLTGLTGVPVVVAVLAVAMITLLLTTVASNTASAAILIPLAIPLAGVLGINPTLLVVVVAIASSIDFALVVGTPPTMIAYATRLYTAGQIFRTGIILDFVGVVLLVFVVTRIWELVGLI